MPTLATKKLADNLGVEVLGVDVERLLTDETVPGALLDLLEQHSVLLFRQLHIDDDAQVKFCRRLGELALFPKYRIPEIMEISFEPDNPNREYFASNDYWHIDGALDEIPAKASVLSAQVVPEQGGQTEWADMRAAYDELDDGTRARLGGLRAFHSN